MSTQVEPVVEAAVTEVGDEMLTAEKPPPLVVERKCRLEPKQR